MASEIRVDKINSLSGVGTVTLSPTGVDIAGITTAATLRATTGIVTSLTAGSLTSLGAVSGTTGTFTGGITATGGNIVMNDSSGSSANRIKLGTSQDLELYHNGSNSMIEDNGTGNLEVRTNGTKVTLQGGNNPMINAIKDGAVELYYNNSKKLETSSAGAILSGNLSIDANIIHNGDTDTMLSFSDANQVDIKCSDAVIGRFTTNGLALGDNKRLDIFDASGHRSGTINNSDSGANSLRISADPDNSGSSTVIGFHIDGSEKARVDSTGDVTISDGDLVIGTAGHGIDFSAQTATSATGASNTAEILDHYEEGTWTPSFLNLESAPTYGFQGGTYTRIGRAVHCQFQISVDSGLDNTDSSGINIGGLPFAGNSAHESVVFSFGKLTNLITNANLALVTNFRFGGNYIMLHRGSSYDLNYQACNTSGHLQGAFTYQMS